MEISGIGRSKYFHSPDLVSCDSQDSKHEAKGQSCGRNHFEHNLVGGRGKIVFQGDKHTILSMSTVVLFPKHTKTFVHAFFVFHKIALSLRKLFQQAGIGHTGLQGHLKQNEDLSVLFS